MLYNITGKRGIINKVRIADTEIRQAVGLMFSRGSRFNYCLIFPRPTASILGSSIHMMFVFFPINVIFLDEKKRVVDIRKNLVPFWFYAPKKPAKYILELATTVNINFVKLNDKLDWD